MRRGFILSLVVLAAGTRLAAQNPLEIFAKPSNDFVFVGQIVLYDPFIHRNTATDDFILHTNDPKIPYVRITYRPMWGFDAPAASPDDILERKAFNGDHILWSFLVHSPANSEEAAGCRSQVWQLETRKDGRIVNSKVSRFVVVPGAIPGDIPALESLPCYVLKRKGWSIQDSEVTATKAKNAGANSEQSNPPK
jgi:hypothetical protein